MHFCYYSVSVICFCVVIVLNTSFYWTGQFAFYHALSGSMSRKHTGRLMVSVKATSGSWTWSRCCCHFRWGKQSESEPRKAQTEECSRCLASSRLPVSLGLTLVDSKTGKGGKRRESACESREKEREIGGEAAGAGGGGVTRWEGGGEGKGGSFGGWRYH